ncbi:MAG: HD domain-containing protein [Spirochaetes bacterium]|nr:HD domain-containing protein [Spirochaetota bacterium]
MEEQRKVKINLDFIRPNSKIIFPLYSEAKEKVVEERVILSLRMIEKIRKDYGPVLYTFIPSDYGVIPRYRLEKAVDKSREIYDEILYSRTLSKNTYSCAEKIIEGIISDIDESKIESINLLKCAGSNDEYLYQHSVNVGIIAAVFARMLGTYTPEEIKYLALGAYLIDIGLVKIDKKLLNKNGKFSPDEMKKIKEHPQIGYDILKKVEGINPIVLQVLLFHHEKLNSNGYYHLPFANLPEPPRIASICDIFDALTSKRPFRDEMSATRALKCIVNSINCRFDYNLVSDFVNHLGPLLNNSQSFYSKHDFCELSTRELALIRDFSFKDYMKPKVMVFCRFKKKNNKIVAHFYDNPIEVDLEEDRNRLMVKILDNHLQIRAIKSRLIDKGLMPQIH